MKTKFVWLVAVASLIVPLFGAARADATVAPRATDPSLILPIAGGAIAVDDATGHVYVTRRNNVSVYDLAGTKLRWRLLAYSIFLAVRSHFSSSFRGASSFR